MLIESSTYRYYGHSLSDPRNEYRTREEEEAWRAVDPIENLGRQLVAAGVLDEAGLAAVKAAAAERNAVAAKRAAAATDPDPADVLTFMYAGTVTETVPAEFASPKIYEAAPVPKVTEAGMLQRDALREAMVEEMTRDSRVIFYGEDVADYGGAFKASKGLMETFGRDRVFNTPISEAAICGTGVGAAMAGLRPVVELMYMDFALMASDQIANQAGKWHYMSGAQTTVPLVIRASVGAGKGYGGQHSQSLESIFTHTPGLVVIYPATAADAKGLLKSAIRSDDPVLFCESQALYAERGPIPDDPDYLVPIGVARVAREGSDATIVAWGPAVTDALAAAETLAGEGVECDVIDLRTLVPLDMETVLASVRKTGRCVVAAQAVLIGSYVNEIVARVVAEAFDDLDAPVARIGAANGISPQAEGLEAAFLPNATDIAECSPRAHLMAVAIRMPMPGQMTEECTVLQWFKKEGDTVVRGDPLFEIETDKSNMEIEAFDEGVLLRIDAPEGATVPVESIVAWIGQPGEELPEAVAAGGRGSGGRGRWPALPPPLPPPLPWPLPRLRPRSGRSRVGRSRTSRAGERRPDRSSARAPAGSRPSWASTRAA